MKSGPALRIAFPLVLAFNTTVAFSDDCAALADNRALSAKARQLLVQTCAAEQSQAVRGNHDRGDNKIPAAETARADLNIDLSTDLEATAAGLNNGQTKANSGHSFVRLKRVTE